MVAHDGPQGHGILGLAAGLEEGVQVIVVLDPVAVPGDVAQEHGVHGGLLGLLGLAPERGHEHVLELLYVAGAVGQVAVSADGHAESLVLDAPEREVVHLVDQRVGRPERCPELGAESVLHLGLVAARYAVVHQAQLLAGVHFVAARDVGDHEVVAVAHGHALEALALAGDAARNVLGLRAAAQEQGGCE